MAKKTGLIGTFLFFIFVFSVPAIAASYESYFFGSKYQSQKMKDVLVDDDRYEIVTFSADLFDYDYLTINDSLNSVTSDGNGFHFTGYEISGMESNNGINNAAATHAKQGIIQESLKDGLPVINYLNGDDAGVYTGKILFSEDEEFLGKTIYKDVQFEMVYDKQTGYYEYKSSANHAQFNKNSNTVELYADTLSTQNSYATTIDLSTGEGINDLIDSSATSQQYIATAQNSDLTTRLDPFISFPVTGNINTSTIGQIYIKAKIPQSVGANTFQLFFDTVESPGMAETKSFKHKYTSTGDYIEFIIDTSDTTSETGTTNWTGTLKNIRIDLFDEDYDEPNDTILSDGFYEIEIAQISLINKNIDNIQTRGGFYPFSEIEDSFPGNNLKFDLDSWKSFLQQSGIAIQRASRSIFNPVHKVGSELYEELAYGMSLGFDFYIPAEMPENGLTYYFNGDDDLWVFVDGKLVLDIGGGHGAITGIIDFAAGTAYVENAVTVTGYDSGADATYAPVTTLLPEDLTASGRHSLKIFYLERGGAVSNCYMKFNLPQYPSSAIEVKKEVVNQSGVSIENTPDTDYKFQLYLAEDDNDDVDIPNEQFLSAQNMYYYKISQSGEETREKTDSTGVFSLKHGETATFYEVPSFTEVYALEETPEDNFVYVGCKVSINDEQLNDIKYDTKSDTVVVQYNSKTTFEFINNILALPNPVEKTVTIDYEIVGPEDCGELSSSSEQFDYQEAPKGSIASVSPGFEFRGWYTDKDCTKLAGTDYEFLPQRNEYGVYVSTTYYAKFTPITEEVPTRINAVVPMYVCMYAYNGDGEVIEPTRYGITNFSNVDIEVVNITVKNKAWNTVTHYTGIKSLSKGEIFLNINGTILNHGENVPDVEKGIWTIRAAVDNNEDNNYLNLPITSYIAGGNVNAKGCFPALSVEYSIKGNTPE